MKWQKIKKGKNRNTLELSRGAYIVSINLRNSEGPFYFHITNRERLITEVFQALPTLEQAIQFCEEYIIKKWP